MIPVLLAEESMREYERVGVATGRFERRDSQAIVARWQREAKRESTTKTAPEKVAQMDMGIGVRRVPKRQHG